MRIRGLRFVAAVLVAAGVILVLTGEHRDLARGMLIAGLVYAVIYLLVGRRRS